MERPPAVTSASLARLPERVRLRDGSHVVIRLLEPNDGPLVQAVFDGMGEEMRYRRFLGFKTQAVSA